ncbi:hypothetical protein H5P28_02160 [Ruficoccus amylovorans]|uniref:LamG-like jellyroll fold domain-containing protein n=1 Tax=Ruficoccus amylovorans TaxID=1804625 RepID=A0A842H9T4_9BACT|nr:LamG-like jellyroll fold domain-containing protein [Ruficoccus amylovorans]MBC2593055.1 hypothetical protein [Ruficoccus amylovorans]
MTALAHSPVKAGSAAVLVALAVCAIASGQVAGAQVKGVEIVSPSRAVCLTDRRASVRLKAAVLAGADALAYIDNVVWSVNPAVGAVLTAESGGWANVNFSADGVYSVTASVEAEGTVHAASQTVVVGRLPAGEGLAAEWLFEGTGPVLTDTSGHGLDGQLSNSEDRGPGVAGSAYHAQALVSQKVTVEDFPSLPEVTVSAWVKADSVAGRFPRIIDGEEWVFFLGLDGSWVPSLKFARQYDTGTSIWHTPIGSIETGRWYHVAVSWKDGDEAPRLYIDGIEQLVTREREVADNAVAIVKSGTAYLGNDEAGERGLDGTLDELRVYGRELSPQDIAVLSANHAPALTAQPDSLTGGGNLWEPSIAAEDRDAPLPLSYHWDVLEAAGAWTVEDASSESPVFDFAAAGVYKVALDIDDGQSVVRYAWDIAVQGMYRVFMTMRNAALWQRAGDRVEIVLGVEPAPTEPLRLSYSLGGDAVAGEDFVPLPGEVVIQGGETRTMIEVEALTRMSGEARVLTLTLEDSGDYEAEGEAVLVAFTPYSYENWAVDYGFATGVSPAKLAPTADVNADGISNLTEYALGVDPWRDRGESVRKRLPRVSVGGDGVLSLSYIRPAGADPAFYTVGVSDSPRGMSFAPLAAPESVSTNTDGTETVTVTDSAPLGAGEQRFLLLRVSAGLL